MLQEDGHAVRYHIDDVARLDANDSHSIIMGFIDGASSLVDVGCATGYIGKSLQGRGIRLVGLELDPVAAELAKPYYERVIVGDVTSPALLNQLENGSFDTIVLGDVIEHLTDPWAFVKAIIEKLAPDGNLIISIPNLGHASVVASLLAGSFNYRDMGLLDATHLRFFGLQSLCSLVMDAGLTPVELHRVRHGTFETEIPVEIERLPARLLPLLEQCPDSRTYQFIIKARNSAPQQALASYVEQFSLPLADTTEDDLLLKSCLGNLDKLRQELRDARDYIATCTAAIQEKDMTIDVIAQERASLLQNVSHLAAAGDGLQKQLAIQIQKTGELNTLVTRLRAAANENSNLRPAAPAADPVDIIIPVYNAFDETRACLASVLRHTDARHRIHVVDDASTDPRVRPYLERQARRYDQLQLVTNDCNQGFIKTVNAALSATRGDVIVLNSDTIVTADWAEKLAAAAGAVPNTGIVCPLSNNATILSVPNMNSDNRLPDGMSIDRFGCLVSEVSLRSYPSIPTAVGFCMYITRQCLNDTGLLDEIFGMGYGEENDFAMRARERGYGFRIADDTFVYHSGSTSFKTQSGDLDQRKLANEKLLGERWPEYHRTILAFSILNPLREVQQRIHDGISRWRSGNKPHIMHVVHSYHAMSGTELHTRQVASGLSPFYRATVFFPDRKVCNTDAETHPADESIMELRYAMRNLSSGTLFDNAPSSLANVVVETNFERILRNSDVKLVHFQHMLNYGTFRLPLIARNLGLKVVITLHDYFYLCPVYNLVKRDRTTMCHRLGPDATMHDCRDCFQGKLAVDQKTGTNDFGAYMTTYLARRKEAVKEALLTADTIIAPSLYVKEKYTLALGEETGSRITVIPHGVSIPDRPIPRETGKQMRVSFLGNATSIKGFDVFGEAAKLLRNRPVMMQSFGAGEDSLLRKYKGIVKVHGPYKPEDLPDILSKSDVVVIPSVWEETFCLTLSEAMAHGVPVIASDVGALSERLIPGENGLLFAAGSAESLADSLESLFTAPGRLKEMKEYCLAHPPLCKSDMLEIYRDAYDELLAGQ